MKMCKENFNGECSSGKGRKALVAFVETLVSKDAPFDTGKLSPAGRSAVAALFQGKAGCIQMSQRRLLLRWQTPQYGRGGEYGGLHQSRAAHDLPLGDLSTMVCPTPTTGAAMWVFSWSARTTRTWANSLPPPCASSSTPRRICTTVSSVPWPRCWSSTNRGGGKDDPLANELKPLGLSASEKADLVAFLESMSSASPVTVEKVVVPQKYKAIANWIKVNN